jgi:putative FmdB family regulatory protein
MPIFEYRCPKCELVFEELVSGENRDTSIACPNCGSKETEKLMSVIGAISMGKSSSNTYCQSHCSNTQSCASSGCCPHAAL